MMSCLESRVLIINKLLNHEKQAFFQSTPICFQMTQPLKPFCKINSESQPYGFQFSRT